MIKNTFKLLFNNISSVWKVLLYKIITIICVVGLTTVICLPIINQLLNQNFFVFAQENLSKLFLNFNLNDFVETLILILKKLYHIVNDAGLIGLGLSVGISSIVVYYFVDNLIILPLIDDERSYMSNNLKLGFMNCYIANFGKSVKYSLVRLVTIFLWDALTIFTGGVIYLAVSKSVFVLAPILSIIVILLMLTARTTFLISVETAIEVHNCGIIEAVKKSFKSTSKKFTIIFSDSLILYTMLLILNMFGLFFTFGVANLFIYPMSLIVMIIFKNVVYYECNGMRYYTDSDNIIMPKKLEEQDKFSKVQDII